MLWHSPTIYDDPWLHTHTHTHTHTHAHAHTLPPTALSTQQQDLFVLVIVRAVHQNFENALNDVRLPDKQLTVPAYFFLSITQQQPVSLAPAHQMHTRCTPNAHQMHTKCIRSCFCHPIAVTLNCPEPYIYKCIRCTYGTFSREITIHTGTQCKCAFLAHPTVTLSTASSKATSRQT